MACAIVVCHDLIFQTKIVGTAKALGMQVEVFPAAGDVRTTPVSAGEARQPAVSGTAFGGRPSEFVLIIDLDCPSASESELLRLRRDFPPPVRMVVYGPHIDVEKLRMARRTGADEVLPRSEFSKRLAEILCQPPRALRDPDRQ